MSFSGYESFSSLTDAVNQSPARLLVATHALLWTVSVVLLSFLIFCFTQSLQCDARSISSLAHAPILGDLSGSWISRCAAYIRWTTDGVGMIKEGYLLNPNAIYRVPTFQLFYIIPAKHIHTLKDAPITGLNATHAIVWYFLGKYTGIDFPLFGRPLWMAVRKLNTNLPHLIPTLHELSVHLCDKWFPKADDWTEIAPWSRVLHLVAATNTRIFIGEKFCDDIALLVATEEFAQNIAVSAGLLKLVPDMLKPILALVLPQLYRLRRARMRVRDIIVSEIELRRQRRDEEQDTGHTERQVDMLEMFETIFVAGQMCPEQIADRVLSLYFAGTHGPSNHVMNVLLDLAARWDEYAEELRAEIDTVLFKTSGLLTNAGLNKLHKLESFMKECARLEPGSALSFYRKVLEPVQLTTGEILPASSLISVPAIASALSEACYGDNAHKFDGLRFYRWRREMEDCSSPSQLVPPREYLWSTPSSGFLNFGYGQYACPGRFYAGAQTKLIIACILHKYDLRLRLKERRPQSLSFGDANIPDPRTKLLYRSRQNPKLDAFLYAD